MPWDRWVGSGNARTPTLKCYCLDYFRNTQIVGSTDVQYQDSNYEDLSRQLLYYMYSLLYGEILSPWKQVTRSVFYLPQENHWR